MPDLSHLWQRFVLASALVFGLALGVAATIFGYSNTAPVDVGFSVVHLTGIPLWTVAIVPLVVILAAGTLYHWWNGLHHFSEHMRHRKRVRELEAEVASLRAHLDNVLEMPEQATTKPAPAPLPEVEAATASPEPVPASNGDDKSLVDDEETEVVAVKTDAGDATKTTKDTKTRAETQPGA